MPTLRLHYPRCYKQICWRQKMQHWIPGGNVNAGQVENSTGPRNRNTRIRYDCVNGFLLEQFPNEICLNAICQWMKNNLDLTQVQSDVHLPYIPKHTKKRRSAQRTCDDAIRASRDELMMGRMVRSSCRDVVECAMVWRGKYQWGYSSQHAFIVFQKKKTPSKKDRLLRRAGGHPSDIGLRILKIASRAAAAGWSKGTWY